MGRRFELDATAERGIAWLRLAGAALVLACAIWMMVSDPTPLAWVFIVLMVLLSLGWTAAGLRGRRRAGRGSDWFLDVSDEGLTLAEPGKRLDVSWSDVTAVEIDEDRLLVLVRTRTGAELPVQPRYRGVGLHELGAALEDAHRRATARDGD